MNTATAIEVESGEKLYVLVDRMRGECAEQVLLDALEGDAGKRARVFRNEEMGVIQLKDWLRSMSSAPKVGRFEVAEVVMGPAKAVARNSGYLVERWVEVDGAPAWVGPMFGIPAGKGN